MIASLTAPAAGSPFDTHATPPDVCTVEARDTTDAGPATGTIETEPGAYLGCPLCDEGIGHRPFCRRNFIARRPFVYRGAVEITRWEEEAA